MNLFLVSAIASTLISYANVPAFPSLSSACQKEISERTGALSTSQSDLTKTRPYLQREFDILTRYEKDPREALVKAFESKSEMCSQIPPSSACSQADCRAGIDSVVQKVKSEPEDQVQVFYRMYRAGIEKNLAMANGQLAGTEMTDHFIVPELERSGKKIDDPTIQGLRTAEKINDERRAGKLTNREANAKLLDELSGPNGEKLSPEMREQLLQFQKRFPTHN